MIYRDRLGTHIRKVDNGMCWHTGYATAYSTVNYTLQHYYSADTFNENSPPSSDPAFLKAYSAATHKAMAAADAQAVWVCQVRGS
jgi:hypothetical protein